MAQVWSLNPSDVHIVPKSLDICHPLSPMWRDFTPTRLNTTVKFVVKHIHQNQTLQRTEKSIQERDHLSVVFATKDSVKKLIFKSMKQLTAAPLHTSVLTVIKPLDILPTSTRTLPPTVMSGPTNVVIVESPTKILPVSNVTEWCIQEKGPTLAPFAVNHLLIPKV